MTLKQAIGLRQPGPLYVIALLILLQLAITLFTDGFALSFDEAMWQYIGRNWFRYDLLPYTGGVDNKSPLIFAIFGLSDQLFGVNYWFPRLFGTLCQSAGIWYVYKIARLTAGPKAGILAISFYGLSLLWHATGGKYVSYTETYEVMFIILAVYRFITAQRKRDYFLGGFLAGIALGFRLTALFGITTLVLASLPRGRAAILMLCAGAVSGVLFLTIICLFAGIDIHSVFTYALADNFGQGSATDHNFAWRMQNLSAKFVFSGMILFYPLVAAYFIVKRKIDLFVLWLIFAFIGINAVGIYDNVHLKEVLPSLSLMSAFAVTRLLRDNKISFKLLVLVIWIAFLPRLSESYNNLKILLLHQAVQPAVYCREPFIIPDEGDRKKLGWWIRSNTRQQDRVYVAGYGAQVQAYSERISPTIYFNVTQTRIAKERFYRDMLDNRPSMILIPSFPQYKQVVGRDMRQFVDEMVSKGYYLDKCLYNYSVYRIRK
jgi:hypothetical protein